MTIPVGLLTAYGLIPVSQFWSECAISAVTNDRHGSASHFNSVSLLNSEISQFCLSLTGIYPFGIIQPITLIYRKTNSTLRPMILVVAGILLLL